MAKISRIEEGMTEGYWMLDTGCWSYRVSTPVGAETDTGCWILDAGLCGSGSKRPMRRQL